ncbi:hypothetical protein [Nocardia otitidiscaviarum]|uniref:hypothetical protein n=1 Tax=Nocardia otitidiscaviarum TaxID=1823 RepID=UPI001893758D|nr:hypothetical protein [Nocardia otitidiscaviarum]MBF6181956.1 hypothetical protein [Nocardia otitidiscaviarum]
MFELLEFGAFAAPVIGGSVMLNAVAVRRRLVTMRIMVLSDHIGEQLCSPSSNSRKPTADEAGLSKLARSRTIGRHG